MYIVTEHARYDTYKFIVELRADSASDLPTLTEEPSMAMGSIAYVIDEGKFYVLNSSGEWVSQDGADASPQAQTLTLGRSALLSTVEETLEENADGPDEPDVRGEER
jgi:hypothetical protein